MGEGGATRRGWGCPCPLGTSQGWGAALGPQGDNGLLGEGELQRVGGAGGRQRESGLGQDLPCGPATSV